LRSAVGVKNSIATDQTTSGGEVEGVADQVGAHVVGHRVPDHLAGLQVDHRGQTEPALACGHVGDVADQPFAGSLGGEVAADQIRYGCGGLILPGQRPASSSGEPDDPVLVQNPAHAL
jgi:hypothetical protein